MRELLDPAGQARHHPREKQHDGADRVRGIEDGQFAKSIGTPGEQRVRRNPGEAAIPAFDVRWSEQILSKAAHEGSGRERRYGALASWYPSEFSRLRLEASYDRRPDGGDGLEALLALEFVIGSHGAHPF